MWVARDEDGELYIYENKPTKYNFVWNTHYSRKMYLNRDLLPEVKWEDTEPKEVELIIKNNGI